MKLRIIAAALNELNEDTLDEFPKFTTDEYAWHPWFYLYTQEDIDNMNEENKKKVWRCGGGSVDGARCGLAYASSGYAWAAAYAYLSARLAVKSEELAKYFGKQFIDIWADYLVKQ